MLARHAPLAALVAFAALMPAGAQTAKKPAQKQETPAQFAARTRWWREAKFGMFIHWGVYSVPASASGGAEWYFSGSRLQVKDYEKFAPQFNPVKFDAKKWVSIAKAAGMKYIVITSKHHDGFCMFDSQLTDYTIVKATPFGRDPMKELAEECKKQGIVLCFYHSIMDWHHPDYLPRRPWETTTRPAAGASLDRYIDHMKGQLRELLTNYGRIGVIWFDGGWEHNATELRSAEVNAMIRSIQPKIIINDRNQLAEDHSTPEQTIPAGAMKGGRLWETCMTINDTWGYTKDNTNWKSTQDLVRKLCDIAHKGGNFLLNVGPTELGEFPAPIVERLAQVGDWMKVNRAAIYGTSQSPFKKLPFDGRCTVKGDKLYLIVFNWPEEGLALPGLKTQVLSARALDGSEPLAVKPAAGGETVYYLDKPSKISDLATVVELTLAGKPVADEAAPVQKPASGGLFTLKAVDAEVHGNTAQYEQGPERDNIGFWIDQKDFVTWTIEVPRDGNYQIEVTYACPNENAGSEFSVGVDGRPLCKSKVQATGSWGTFKPFVIGELDLKAGKQVIAVRALSMPAGAVMNLQTVKLAAGP